MYPLAPHPEWRGLHAGPLGVFRGVPLPTLILARKQPIMVPPDGVPDALRGSKIIDSHPSLPYCVLASVIPVNSERSCVVKPNEDRRDWFPPSFHLTARAVQSGGSAGTAGH